MAVIGKIRSRLGGLLVIMIGGALMLFVLDDLIGNRGRSGRSDRSIGTIDGEAVDQATFERRVSNETDALRNDFNQPVDNNAVEQIRNSVWNEVVKERVLKPQAEEAGFGTTLSKEEYDDIRFGNNVSPDFRSVQAFQDPNTGQLDKEKLRQWFANVQTGSPTYYAIQKQRLIDGRIYAKYNTLVKKSLFVNSAQGRDEFDQKNMKATFNFVVKPFNSEPDSLYPVSESDLKRYYDQHKNDRKYQQKASRSFDYVSFPVVASDEDKAAILKDIASLRPEFEAAANDSVFVLGNSDSRNYSVVPYAQGTADQLTDSLITHATVGQVVGPYQEGEQLKLAKVKELADVPEARVRHILLKTDGSNDEVMKKRADSLLTVLKRDRSKFDEMVKKFSEDPGSVGNGGVYEWFDRNRMVPEFTKASFDEKVGAITVCKTSYGYHIVEVLGHRDRKEPRICAVDRMLKPSPATFNNVYKKANEFSLDHNSLEKFKQGAEEEGLDLHPVDDMRLDQRYVSGLSEPAPVIGWVNNAEPGQTSGPLRAGDVYVVCALRRVKEDGAPELEDVRETFTREVVKEKKAEAYRAQLAGNSDLNALAQEQNLAVQSANEMTYSQFNIPGGFNENKVIGRIFALQPGQISEPLTGDQGVYVVQMNTLTPPPEITDVSTEKKSLADRLQGRAEGALFNALRDAAGVVDERGKYY